MILPALFVLSFNQSYAEYVAFKNTPQGRQEVSEEEFNQLYAVLMRYQFPMNTNPYVHPVQNGDELVQKLQGYKQTRFKTDVKRGASLLASISQSVGIITPLSVKEIEQLGAGEEKFIRQKIKELNPDFDIAFIPTTVYELASLAPFKKPSGEESAIINDLDTLRDLTHLSSKNGDLQLFWQSYLCQNYLPNIRQRSFMINKDILKRFNFRVEDLNGAEKQKLVKTLFYESHFVFRQVQEFSEVSSRDFDPQAFDALNKAIALEYEAHQNNKAILWRGTKAYASSLFRKTSYTMEEFEARADEKERQNFIDSTIREALEESAGEFLVKGHYYANSYGNSLFAGRRDIGKAGAMAFQYIMSKSFIGYGLLVDKAQYLTAESKERRLFFIAPLSTVVGLFAMGEFFHSRSRIALCSDTVPDIWGFTTAPHEFAPPTTQGNFLAFNASPLTPASHEKVFSEYVAANMRIIRNATGEEDARGRVIKKPIDEAVLKENQVKSPEEKFPLQKKLLLCVGEK